MEGRKNFIVDVLLLSNHLVGVIVVYFSFLTLSGLLGHMSPSETKLQKEISIIYICFSMCLILVTKEKLYNFYLFKVI